MSQAQLPRSQTSISMMENWPNLEFLDNNDVAEFLSAFSAEDKPKKYRIDMKSIDEKLKLKLPYVF